MGMMRIGTRSLLFGVHQVLWHPLTVLRAWWRLYGRPSWREVVCIIVHDWGYWAAPNMDGEEGEQHPELAARLALRWFGAREYHLCLFHSRHYARRLDAEPSPLCWADKLSIVYDPAWFYLLRARASGELTEYRQVAAAAGVVPLTASDREWFAVIRARFKRAADELRSKLVGVGGAQ
jgi:hypothetical protein